MLTEFIKLATSQSKQRIRVHLWHTDLSTWQIDGETVETVSDFIFLGSKITAAGDCSHEIKRHLLLGWMASPTRWMWVWVNSGRWWWTGRPGVLWFMGSQRVGHGWATKLNWTEGRVQSPVRGDSELDSLNINKHYWDNWQTWIGSKEVAERVKPKTKQNKKQQQKRVKPLADNVA